jgi:hypothetical protein
MGGVYDGRLDIGCLLVWQYTSFLCFSTVLTLNIQFLISGFISFCLVF